MSDQHVVITGGANGIGQALAEALMDKAAKVIVVDKDEEAIKRLIAKHERMVGYVADLTDYKQVGKVVGRIYEENERVNVLVNNAGYIHSEPLVNLLSREDKKHSLSTWQKTLDLNLNTVFYMTAHVVEQMVIKRNKGVIINISSIVSYGNAGQTAYSAAKGAVNAMTITWGKELGMFGIRCNAIAPGFFNTPSTASSLTEARLKAYKKNTPVGRLGETKEIVQAVEFIVANDFYNGAILDLNGGLTI